MIQPEKARLPLNGAQPSIQNPHGEIHIYFLAKSPHAIPLGCLGALAARLGLWSFFARPKLTSPGNGDGGLHGPIKSPPVEFPGTLIPDWIWLHLDNVPGISEL